MVQCMIKVFDEEGALNLKVERQKFEKLDSKKQEHPGPLTDIDRIKVYMDPELFYSNLTQSSSFKAMMGLVRYFVVYKTYH